MTAPLDLDALEAKAKAATPGPWISDGGEFEVRVLSVDANTKHSYLLAEVHADQSDGDFIAAARTAVPQLCARVRELEHLDVGYRKCCAETSAQIAGLQAILAEAERALESIAKYAGHIDRCQPNLNCRGGCDQARYAEAALQRIRAAKGATG